MKRYVLPVLTIIIASITIGVSSAGFLIFGALGAYNPLLLVPLLIGIAMILISIADLTRVMEMKG